MVLVSVICERLHESKKDAFCIFARAATLAELSEERIGIKMKVKVESCD